ncbi:conserved hypothetical protein [Pseudomonas sp. IT-P100]
MENFYIVGVYEDFKLDIFPTHASPIIAERINGEYRRWAYRIEFPYKITPTHSVGGFYKTPTSMFPYLTYNLNNPTQLKYNSQIVAISKNTILVESNKTVLCLKIMRAALINIKTPRFIYRSYTTIKNVLS